MSRVSHIFPCGFQRSRIYPQHTTGILGIWGTWRKWPKIPKGITQSKYIYIDLLNHFLNHIILQVDPTYTCISVKKTSSSHTSLKASVGRWVWGFKYLKKCLDVYGTLRKENCSEKNKCNNCYTLPENNNKKNTEHRFFCCLSFVSHPKNHTFFLRHLSRVILRNINPLLGFQVALARDAERWGSMGLAYLPTWMVDFYCKCR